MAVIHIPHILVVAAIPSVEVVDEPNIGGDSRKPRRGPSPCPWHHGPFRRSAWTSPSVSQPKPLDPGTYDSTIPSRTITAPAHVVPIEKRSNGDKVIPTRLLLRRRRTSHVRSCRIDSPLAARLTAIISLVRTHAYSCGCPTPATTCGPTRPSTEESAVSSGGQTSQKAEPAGLIADDQRSPELSQLRRRTQPQSVPDDIDHEHHASHSEPIA